MWIFKKKSSYHYAGRFDSLTWIDLIVFGNYSNGFPVSEFKKIENSINSWLSFKEIVINYTEGIFPQEEGESLIDYEHRINKTVEEKVKIFFIAIVPISAHQEFRDFRKKYEYLLESIDVFDPNDVNLFFPKREYALSICRYKFSGKIFLHIDSGTQIPQKKLQKLFKIFTKMGVYARGKLPNFKGNCYWLSRKLA